jgi:hypothetical protein
VVLAAVTVGLTILPASMTISLYGSALAATTVNGSKSNSFKTAADCTKAGGKWGKGREGLGCYLPLPANPPAAGKTTTKK